MNKQNVAAEVPEAEAETGLEITEEELLSEFVLTKETFTVDLVNGKQIIFRLPHSADAYPVIRMQAAKWATAVRTTKNGPLAEFSGLSEETLKRVFWIHKLAEKPKLSQRTVCVLALTGGGFVDVVYGQVIGNIIGAQAKDEMAEIEEAVSF